MIHTWLAEHMVEYMPHVSYRTALEAMLSSGPCPWSVDAEATYARGSSSRHAAVRRRRALETASTGGLDTEGGPGRSEAAKHWSPGSLYRTDLDVFVKCRLQGSRMQKVLT